MSVLGKFIGKYLGKKVTGAVDLQISKNLAKDKLDFNESFEFEFRLAKSASITAAIIGLILSAGSFILFLIELAKPAGMYNELYLLLALGIVFLLLVMYNLIESKHTVIKISNSFIDHKRFFGSNEEIRWSEVKTISFDNKKQLTIIHGIDTVIKVPLRFVGSMVLLRFIVDKIDVSLYAISLAQSELFLEMFGKVLDNKEQLNLVNAIKEQIAMYQK